MAQKGEPMVEIRDCGERPAKRVLQIEAALRWAYRDELPKQRPEARTKSALGRLESSWLSMARVGELGTVIDFNGFGVLHDPAAVGAPHPDALRIAEAVQGLDSIALDLAEDWRPFGDLGDLGEAGEAARIRAIDAVSLVVREGRQRVRQLKARPRELVQKYACLGGAPDWQAERPEIKFESNSANGKPKWFRRKLVTVEGAFGDVPREIEVDGFDAKARRPYPDAYRKTYLDPDPVEAAIWRAEYQVWVTALDVLAIDLEGVLETIEIRPSDRTLAPWEDPNRREPQILRPIDEKPVRPMTLGRGFWGAVETLTPNNKRDPRRYATLFGERMREARARKAAR